MVRIGKVQVQWSDRFENVVDVTLPEGDWYVVPKDNGIKPFNTKGNQLVPTHEQCGGFVASNGGDSIDVVFGKVLRTGHSIVVMVDGESQTVTRS